MDNIDMKIGICPVCRNSIYYSEQHYVDSGRDYHEHCWIKMIGIKFANLEAKTEKQEITIAEAQDMIDYKKMLLDNVIGKHEEQPIKRKSFLTSPSEQLITRPKIRESCMTTNRDAEFKRLELQRAIRWQAELEERQQRQIEA
jgi:hypothetical protein